MATTIKDIAKAAGVSITTVSRALNGYSDVSVETREKIRKLAEEMDYKPNSIAKGLVSNKTSTVGLIASEFIKPGVYHPFSLEIIAGAKAALRKERYDLVLFTVDAAMQQNMSFDRLCEDRKVEGALVHGLRLSDVYIKELETTAIPSVGIDLPVLNEHVGEVSTDNIKAAKDAVNYLIKLGHKRIGLVNGHKDASVTFERLEGYKEALLENGIEYNENFIIFSDFSQQGGYEACKQLLFINSEITAVFFASDLMAIGGIRACQELNINVPQNMSIIGFDDIELASLINPSLTTVRQEKFRLGYVAAEHLLEIIGGAAPRRIYIPHKIIVRESTAYNLL